LHQQNARGTASQPFLATGPSARRSRVWQGRCVVPKKRNVRHQRLALTYRTLFMRTACTIKLTSPQPTRLTHSTTKKRNIPRNTPGTSHEFPHPFMTLQIPRTLMITMSIGKPLFSRFTIHASPNFPKSFNFLHPRHRPCTSQEVFEMLPCSSSTRRSSYRNGATPTQTQTLATART
jgi:hypothetical protein